MQPYIFKLKNILNDEGADEVEERTLTNETTKEQFSVKKARVEDEEFTELFIITIKRGMKTKKKN